MKNLFVFALLLTLSVNSYSQCSVTPAVGIFNHVSCFGGSDGSLTIGYTGGTGPFQYQLNGGPTLATPTFSGLSAGTYTCTIIDMGEGFCSESINFNILQPSSTLTISSSPMGTSCGGVCDGSVVMSVMGGTTPYSYQWQYSGDGGMTWTTLGVFTTTITNVCSGMYRLIVTDAAGCVAMSTTTVNSAPVLVANAISTNANCGACDGSVSVSASGGTGGLATASWSNGATTINQSGMCAGFYTVTITDFAGCVANDTVAVNSSSPLNLNFTTDVSSCDSCNGIINLSAFGGVPPYSFSNDGGAMFNLDSVFTSLCPGTYNCVVQDGAGCWSSQVINVSTSTIPGMTVSSIVHNVTAPGMNDGYINLNLSGAPGVSFEWSNGSVNEDIYSLSSGSYSVLISDGTGNCNNYTYLVNVTPTMGMINGQLFADLDGNCVYSTGDVGLNMVQMQVDPSGMLTYTNSMGNYSFVLTDSVYIVSPALSSSFSMSTGCTVNDTAVVIGGSVTTINFPVDVTSPFTEGSISVFTNPITPGFSNSAYATICNNGFQPLDGVVAFTVPDYTNYLTASITPDSTNGDTLYFHFTSLPIGSCFTIMINYYCPVGTTLGLISTTEAWLTVTSNPDINLANNYSFFNRIIAGSYDPNDKSVSPAGDVLLTDSTFTYLIRFQNTGNAPAINIIVRDTLSNFVDVSTIELLGSSHYYEFSLIDNSVMTWGFDSIMLPDSTNDEPNSHGWILYRIKRNNTVNIGDVIYNTADIYFDFNEPVITNTTESEFVTPSAVQFLVKDENVMIFPNPANEHVYVVTENTEGIIALTDIQGRKIMQQSINGTTTTIDLANVTKGMYVIQVINGNESKSYRLIRN